MLDLELSADTKAIITRLREMAIGELVTYDELSGIIGRDIQRNRYILDSARRNVEREDGAVFGIERGVGIRRMTADEAPNIGIQSRKSIRRKADRGAKRIERAVSRANDLPDDVARKAYGEIATLRLIEHTATERAQPKPKDSPSAPEPIAVTARRMFENLSGKSQRGEA